MLKQLFVSLLVIVAAAAGYVYFVPGSTETLARYGIVLPSLAATGEQPATPAAAPREGGNQATRGGTNQGNNPQANQGNNRQQGGQQGGNRRGQAREMVVVTAAVTEAKINDKLNALGEGAAASSVVVMSPASGTLTTLKVRPGDVVKPGDEIGQLDAEAETIAFERAKLALADAEETLTRTEGLAKANAATTVQLSTAQLAVNTARLELQNADLDLKRRTIRSPIGGSVGLFQVSPGNTVNAQSIVTTIEDTSSITISFWVPERYASAVAVGLPITTSAVALPGETISGTISAVDNRIDPASRTLKVEASIPNTAGKLRPGMSFSVAMEFPGESFPSVDPLSIQWSSEGAYLWKYADGKVDRQLVSIIQRNSDGILVKGDVKPGDRVVTQGVQQLTAGATVRLLDDVPVETAGGRPRSETASQ